MHVARKGPDFLEVWTVMVISVEFRKLDPGPEVFCKDLFPGQVSMELGSVNSDPTRRQGLKDNACMYICSVDPGKKLRSI